jgi:hypothetical protein
MSNNAQQFGAKVATQQMGPEAETYKYWRRHPNRLAKARAADPKNEELNKVAFVGDVAKKYQEATSQLDPTTQSALAGGILGGVGMGTMGALGGGVLGGSHREPISSARAMSLVQQGVPVEIVEKLQKPGTSLDEDEINILSSRGVDYDQIAPTTGALSGALQSGASGLLTGGLGGAAAGAGLSELSRVTPYIAARKHINQLPQALQGMGVKALDTSWDTLGRQGQFESSKALKGFKGHPHNLVNKGLDWLQKKSSPVQPPQRVLPVQPPRIKLAEPVRPPCAREFGAMMAKTAYGYSDDNIYLERHLSGMAGYPGMTKERAIAFTRALAANAAKQNLKLRFSPHRYHMDQNMEESEYDVDEAVKRMEASNYGDYDDDTQPWFYSLENTPRPGMLKRLMTGAKKQTEDERSDDFGERLEATIPDMDNFDKEPADFGAAVAKQASGQARDIPHLTFQPPAGSVNQSEPNLGGFRGDVGGATGTAALATGRDAPSSGDASARSEASNMITPSTPTTQGQTDPHNNAQSGPGLAYGEVS